MGARLSLNRRWNQVFLCPTWTRTLHKTRMFMPPTRMRQRWRGLRRGAGRPNRFKWKCGKAWGGEKTGCCRHRQEVARLTPPWAMCCLRPRRHERLAARGGCGCFGSPHCGHCLPTSRRRRGRWWMGSGWTGTWVGGRATPRRKRRPVKRRSCLRCSSQPQNLCTFSWRRKGAVAAWPTSTPLWWTNGTSSLVPSAAFKWNSPAHGSSSCSAKQVGQRLWFGG